MKIALAFIAGIVTGVAIAAIAIVLLYVGTHRNWIDRAGEGG